MSCKEFEEKIKRAEIIQKREASNGHWDAEYREELKKQKQEENEKRYIIIINCFFKEIARRPKLPISKRDISIVISDVLAKSKHVSKRFER